MSCKLIAPAAFLILAACQTAPQPRIDPQAGSLDAAFGESVKWNAAVQIINPDPIYTAEDAQPGDSGAKAAAATRRYRTDNVKDPQRASTVGGTRGNGATDSGPR